jgi:hypothetical protein
MPSLLGPLLIEIYTSKGTIYQTRRKDAEMRSNGSDTKMMSVSVSRSSCSVL